MVRTFEFYIDDNGCHICTSHRIRKGYPVAVFNKKEKNISRGLFESTHGELSKGLVVRHTCDNSMCINVGHLISGTYKENMADKKRRGRFKGGHGWTEKDESLIMSPSLNKRKGK